MKGKYMENLVEQARQTYVKVYTAAINNEFSDKEPLRKLDCKMFDWYTKYHKKPKSRVRGLIYASGTIYNREMIVDPYLWSELYVLSDIFKKKLFTAEKLRNFYDTNGPTFWLKEGVKLRSIEDIVNKLLEV